MSLDGDKELHDSCRIDLQGKGTYDKALNAVKHYCKTYNNNIMPNTKMTISPDNVSYLYNGVISLIQNNYKIIHLNCVFENVWNNNFALILYN